MAQYVSTWLAAFCSWADTHAAHSHQVPVGTIPSGTRISTRAQSQLRKGTLTHIPILLTAPHKVRIEARATYYRDRWSIEDHWWWCYALYSDGCLSKSEKAHSIQANEQDNFPHGFQMYLWLVLTKVIWCFVLFSDVGNCWCKGTSVESR